MRYTARQYLFYKGDIGTKFYIILEGSCSVLIPYVKDDTEELHEVKVYTKGDSFGELALIKNQPRAATILCREDTHFAVLERDDFTRIIGKMKEVLLNRKVDFLMSFPVFTKWTKGSMQKVSYYFQERTYRRRQFVFRIGDESNELYFIRSGEFQVLQSISHTPHKGKAHPLCEMAIISKNQLFGEEDMLENQLRSYTCVCHSTVAEVLVITKDDFFRRVNNEESLNHLKGMHRMKMDFHKKRRETITQVQSVHQDPVIARKPASLRESPVISSSSAATAAIELRKYVLWRNPLFPESPSPLGFATQPTPGTPRKKSIFTAMTPEAMTPVSPSKHATWDRILLRKMTEWENNKCSPPKGHPKVVNIHTTNERKKQLRSLTLRELSDLTGQKSSRKCDDSQNNIFSCLRYDRGLMVVKSLSDMRT